MSDTDTSTIEWTAKAPEVKVGDKVRVLSLTGADSDEKQVIGLHMEGIVGTVDRIYPRDNAVWAQVFVHVVPDDGDLIPQWVGHYEVLPAEAKPEDEKATLKARLIEYGVPGDSAILDTVEKWESRGTPAARWVSDAHPFVEPGDIVMMNDSHEGIILMTEGDHYQSQTCKVYIWLKETGGGSWYFSRWTLKEKWEKNRTEPQVVDRAPVPGDKVRVIRCLDNANDLYKEKVTGLIMQYVGTHPSQAGAHNVKPLPGESWPDLSDGRQPSDTGAVAEVAVLASQGNEPTPAPTEPDWAEKKANLLERLNEEARDRDWCSEYEDAMQAYFGIDPERRTKVNYSVRVELTKQVDPEEYIEADDVFGTSDGNKVGYSSYIDVTTSVWITVEADDDADEIDDDVVEDELDNLRYTYDRFDIEDWTQE